LASECEPSRHFGRFDHGAGATAAEAQAPSGAARTRIKAPDLRKLRVIPEIPPRPPESIFRSCVSLAMDIRVSEASKLANRALARRERLLSHLRLDGTVQGLKAVVSGALRPSRLSFEDRSMLNMATANMAAGTNATMMTKTAFHRRPSLSDCRGRDFMTTDAP
jgi:hypothetical protein